MTADEKAIRDVVDLWMSSSRKGDVATVLDLMTDDVIFMVPGHAPFGKSAFREAAEANRRMRVEGRAEVLEVEVLGDRAWLRNRLEITMTPPDGDAIHRSGHTLTILRRGEDGRWLLMRDANLVL